MTVIVGEPNRYPPSVATAKPSFNEINPVQTDQLVNGPSFTPSPHNNNRLLHSSFLKAARLGGHGNSSPCARGQWRPSGVSFMAAVVA